MELSIYTSRCSTLPYTVDNKVKAMPGLPLVLHPAIKTRQDKTRQDKTRQDKTRQTNHPLPLDPSAQPPEEEDLLRGIQLHGGFVSDVLFLRWERSCPCNVKDPPNCCADPTQPRRSNLTRSSCVIFQLSHSLSSLFSLLSSLLQTD
jgi:hypothetical protein